MRTIKVRLSYGVEIPLRGELNELQEFRIKEPDGRAIDPRTRDKILHLVKEALDIDPYFTFPALNDADHA